jgi:hypothetical protein
VVAGDVTIDWQVASSRREKIDALAWNPDDTARAFGRPGGAALLATVIAEIARTLSSGAAAGWTVVPPAAPTGPLTPDAAAYPHSYALWTQRAAAGQPPAWRVSEYLGLSPARQPIESTARRRARASKPAGRGASIVVLDDANLGFRDQRDRWGPLLAAAGRRPWIVLKMASPVAQGPLWNELVARHADRLIVVMTANDLRRASVQVARGLSWEQTATDLVRELNDNPAINGLAACASAVVSFHAAGAFLATAGLAKASPTREPAPHYQLVFDPSAAEGEWERRHPGGMIGYTTCLTAAIVRSLLDGGFGKDPAAALEAGLAAMRTLHLKGYGTPAASGDETAAGGLAFPTEAVVAALGSPPRTFARAVVPEYLAEADEDDPRFPSWSILQLRYQGPLESLAERIAVEGVDPVVDGVPIGRFGKLVTLDRREIEGLRGVGALIDEYRRQTEYQRQGRHRPLSIAVFGAPGAGKSFSVRQIVKAVLPGRKDEDDIVFNLSQLNDPSELDAAFHRVRDISLTGALPLVFWDEFDATVGDQPLAWLSRFLAPMQDGTFQQGEIIHPIGRAIFVFAGGRARTLSEFATLLDGAEGSKAKLPDFVSRLKGHLSLLGPDPTDGAPDPFFMIRRAILVRSMLDERAPGLFRDDGRVRRANLDLGVLRALLRVPRYRHGARSIESIIAMSRLTDKFAFLRSSLPSESQLDIHVDARAFMDLVEAPELTGALLERMAEAAHQLFCERLRAQGVKRHTSFKPFRDLPEDEKEQNRGTVRDIPTKLAAAGYRMVPARGRRRAFAFPRSVLERLAEQEHERWVRMKVAGGWRHAPNTDKVRLLHRALLPWRKLSAAELAARYGPAAVGALGRKVLPQREKAKDRLLVRGIPKILAEAAYMIVKDEPAA